MGSEPKEIVLKMAVSKLVGYWNLSLDPLEEQAVLLTTGFFSPAPLLCFLKVSHALVGFQVVMVSHQTPVFIIFVYYYLQ